MDARVDKRVRANKAASSANSSTHAHRWALFYCSKTPLTAEAFFAGWAIDAEFTPALPPQLQKRNLELQFQSLHNAVPEYEVNVMQPTFMRGVQAAVLAAEARRAQQTRPFIEWVPTKTPEKLDAVELPYGDLKNFRGGQRWLRGTLSPDFGVFSKGYKATEFSCLLLGEADSKESTKSGLTGGHLGKTLAYGEEVLQQCPFRFDASGFVFSFVTNDYCVRFLRSVVRCALRAWALVVVLSYASTPAAVQVAQSWSCLAADCVRNGFDALDYPTNC